MTLVCGREGPGTPRVGAVSAPANIVQIPLNARAMYGFLHMVF